MPPLWPHHQSDVLQRWWNWPLVRCLILLDLWWCPLWIIAVSCALQVWVCGVKDFASAHRSEAPDSTLLFPLGVCWSSHCLCIPILGPRNFGSFSALLEAALSAGKSSTWALLEPCLTVSHLTITSARIRHGPALSRENIIVPIQGVSWNPRARVQLGFLKGWIQPGGHHSLLSSISEIWFYLEENRLRASSELDNTLTPSATHGS